MVCIWTPINDKFNFRKCVQWTVGEKIDRDTMPYRHLVPFKFPGMLMANGFTKGSFFPSKIFPRTNEFRNAIVRLNWYASIHINRSETRCLYPQWIVINVCSSNFYIIISALKRTNANALRFIIDTTKEKWTRR